MRRLEVSANVPVDSDGQYNLFSERIAKRRAQSYAAAVLLAIYHYNNRDGTVVPEISFIDGECSVYFPLPLFVDSEATSDRAVTALFALSNNDEIDPPCALLAPLRLISPILTKTTSLCPSQEQLE